MGRFLKAHSAFNSALNEERITKGALQRAQAKTKLIDTFNQLVEELYREPRDWDAEDHNAYSKLKQECE